MSDFNTFVGMDVHKKEHRVAMICGGNDIVEWTVRNNSDGIKRMVRRIVKKSTGPVLVCYEAGVCGFALKRQIEALGLRCAVIAPSLIPRKPGERIRTDRRDAKKLVGLLRSGMLTEVHPPEPQDEAARDLCRLRQSAREDLMRIRHQVSKFLLRRAIIYTEGKQWTQRHMWWLAAVEFDIQVDKQIYAGYLAELLHQTQRVASLDRLVEQLAQKQRYSEAVSLLRCFRGIDTVTAITLVTELHGMGRFKKPRQLMSFLGLVPSEDSSGQRQRKGAITKAGNSRVRRVLVEAAHHYRHKPSVSIALRKRRQGQPQWAIDIADRAQERLYRRYCRLIFRGKPSCKAVTATARELVGFVWAVLFVYYHERQKNQAA